MSTERYTITLKIVTFIEVATKIKHTRIVWLSTLWTHDDICFTWAITLRAMINVLFHQKLEVISCILVCKTLFCCVYVGLDISDWWMYNAGFIWLSSV